MNDTIRDWRRNAPAPLEIEVYTDCGLSARTPIVIDICKKIIELQEYFFGLDVSLVLVPGAGNIDERMPLMFLRPCVLVLEDIIKSRGIPVEPPVRYTYSMDYHAFVPWVRDISRAMNEIIALLDD